eukprot:CAMPEP_0114540280 /NCGR_PEP_ID=MMETSP0114-20121206/678_1 /TAXON_ID=31324 /ORGANISM="Goniomonas sp, Strain m" /LENGTH=981 /DNA_ID=CAMNT_0001724421 /DNA_START=71 /DNA_END=3014 /DNA_ORIENTATION=+
MNSAPGGPPSGNIVTIGGMECTVIPGHSTHNQIACITPTRENTQALMDVSIVVEGKAARCTNVCQYEFRPWESPRLYSLKPTMVQQHTIVKMHTLLQENGGFKFLNLSTPKIEEAAGVYVIQNNPNEEPYVDVFGLPGTRCSIFDPEKEEPNTYGVARDFLYCRIGGPQQAGRYNLTVMEHIGEPARSWSAGLGRAELRASTFVDYTGTRYLISHVATVTGIMPTRGATTGGTQITISGNSFGTSAADVGVTVGGRPCVVASVTMTTIICTIKASPATVPKANQTYPGDRGLSTSTWTLYSSLANLLASPNYPDHPEYTGMVREFFDLGSHYSQMLYGVRMRGLFYPPITSNITWYIALDDRGFLSFGNSSEPGVGMEQLMFQNQHSSPRQYDKHPEQQTASRALEFKKGEPRYVEALWKDEGWYGHFSAAAVMHTTKLNRKDAPEAIDEVQSIQAVSPLVPEVTRIAVTGLNATATASNATIVLSVGGKVSEPVNVNVTAGQMLWAVSELFANCSANCTSLAVPMAPSSGGHAFDVTWATVGCQTPTSLLAATAHGAPDSYTVEVTRLQQHTPGSPQGPAFSVSFRGASVDVHSYMTAEEMKARLQLLPVGDIEVNRSGNCSLDGHNYTVTFLSIPGEIELLTATPLAGSSVNVTVKELVRGGLWMAPFPLDHFRQIDMEPQVAVTVRESAAVCGVTNASDTCCGPDIAADFILAHGSDDENDIYPGDLLLSPTGQHNNRRHLVNPDGGAWTSDTVDLQNITMIWSSAHRITRVKTVWLREHGAANYSIWVGKTGKGPWTMVRNFTNMPDTVTREDIADFPPIYGRAMQFRLTKRLTNVYIINQIQVFTTRSRCSFEFKDALVGTVSSVTASSLQNGGVSLSIVGTNMATDKSDNLVDVGGVPCVVHTAASTGLTCNVSSHTAGEHTVTVDALPNGRMAGIYSITFPVTAASVSPSTAPAAVPTEIKVMGNGFHGLESTM